MRYLELNLQLFADPKAVFEGNADKFEEGFTDQFSKISEKMNELGFEVLLNNKSEAEFIPSDRFKSVAAQRDTFKTTIDNLNAQLTELSGAKGTSDELKVKYDEMIAQNNKLITEIETTKIDTEILLEARDAVDPKDVLLFINRDKISIDKNGNFKGVKEEIERLKTEKPHLFGSKAVPKGGADRSPGQDENKVVGMNAMIRKATGRF